VVLANFAIASSFDFSNAALNWPVGRCRKLEKRVGEQARITRWRGEPLSLSAALRIFLFKWNRDAEVFRFAE